MGTRLGTEWVRSWVLPRHVESREYRSTWSVEDTERENEGEYGVHDISPPSGPFALEGLT